MKHRRQLVMLLGAGAFAAPLAAFAQQAGSVPRIGLLWIAGNNSSQYAAALRDGLRAAGYVDGKNIRIDDRSLVDRYELLPEAAGRLVAERMDLIVCFGATAIQLASKATSTIPIVIVMSGDPVGAGVAASLSRPGRNVTGTSAISQELSGKRLELLRELAPGIRRLAVILYPESAAEQRSLKSYDAAARAVGLEVQPVEVHTPEDIDQAITGIGRMNVQAIAAVGSTLLTAYRKQVVAAIERTRLPAIYAGSDFARAGGLVSYAPNYAEGFRRTATYVDKILRGAKPGDIPIEQPTKVELVINLKAAKALGLAVPQSFLLRADELIQ